MPHQAIRFSHICLPIFVTVFTWFSTQTSYASASTDLPREQVLTDPYSRIKDDFHVPPALSERTAFWFDIYTKYTAQQHVIHHELYPWIIFQVVDTKPILDAPGNRWTKFHRAAALVAKSNRQVQHALKKISRMKAPLKNQWKLNKFEKGLLQTLSSIKGSRQTVARVASKNVRVQLGQKDFFLSGLVSSTKYLPIIEQDFIANGLPPELCRLPFVESSFNIEAQSKVGASGIWQIMPQTGKSYLIVNDVIDERNSPLKASLAAIEIFKINYRKLESWPLAVTAYNHGLGGVRSALRKSHSKNLPELITRYNKGSFRFASANFYTSFLAALHAEKYHKEIFASENQTLAALSASPLAIEHQVISILRPIRIKNLLQKIGLNPAELLDYNFDLKRAIRKNSVLPKGYKLILPNTISRNLEKVLAMRRRPFKEASL